MSDECPARMVYDRLVEEAAPAAQRYRELAQALRPLWIEDVVCPINIAVRHLQAAAAAAASGDRAVAAARHESAQASLYDALATTLLLTVEESLEGVAADELLRNATLDEHAGGGSTFHGWGAWRGHGGG